MGFIAGRAQELQARTMGAVHGIEPSAAGLSAAKQGLSTQRHIEILLDRFEDQWHRRRAAESAVLAAAFAWMRTAMPQEPIALRIVHGDCSLRNLMFEGDRPTALLDWETWHLGDPAEDLAYVRNEINGRLAWSEFMAAYHAAGGRGVTDARMHYWSIWREFRGAITSVSMMNSVTEGDADLRSAFGGLFFTRTLIAEVSRRLQLAIDA